MSFFYIITANKIKNFLLIVSVSLFTALLLFTQSPASIPVISPENQPKAIYKGEEGVALTFDIGWGDEKAESILNTLIKHKTKATFFLSGSWAERHPDLVKKMVKHKFEIGILGYNYKDYTELSTQEIIKDIQRARDVFKKLQVEKIQLLRTPTGHFNKTVLKAAEEMDLTLIHWSINTNDWRNPGAAKILEAVENVQDGDIVFLHASDSAKQTNSVLPEMINGISSKNKLVTVSELISNGKVQTKLIP